MGSREVVSFHRRKFAALTTWRSLIGSRFMRWPGEQRLLGIGGRGEEGLESIIDYCRIYFAIIYVYNDKIA